MATVREAPSPPRREPPDWSVVPPPPARPRRAIALRTIAGIAIVGVLWWLGREVAAAVLLVAIVVMTVGSLTIPAFAAVVERATKAVERVTGRLLATVLLALVQALVFAPISLVLKLLRVDPLALGRSPDATSLWRTTPPRRGRPLYRRQFTYEPRADAQAGAAPDRLPLPRLRAVLGIVVLLAIADLGLGLVLHHFDHTSDPAAAARRQSLLQTPSAAAGRGEPWLPDLARAIDDVWYGKRLDPFLGWAMPDHRSRWLNVTGGVRRSYEPTVRAGVRPVDVDFFGGSTMFGLFQRDAHTIPSEVARLAEADGIPVRVSNYGRMAYNNWQESTLLSELASDGHVPDLAVFYDGANELVGQFRIGPHVEPGHQEQTEYARRIGFGPNGGAAAAEPAGSRLGELSGAWADASALSWVERRLRGAPTEDQPITQPVAPPWAVDQRRTAVEVGRDAARVYAQGVRATRTSRPATASRR